MQRAKASEERRLENVARSSNLKESLGNYFSTIRQHYDAATFYISALRKAEDTMDPERRISLLLRIADSFEDFGSELEKEAAETSGKQAGKKRLSAYKSFVGAANYLHEIYEQSLYNREDRLIQRAEQNLQMVPDSLGNLFFTKPLFITRAKAADTLGKLKRGLSRRMYELSINTRWSDVIHKRFP